MEKLKIHSKSEEQKFGVVSSTTSFIVSSCHGAHCRLAILIMIPCMEESFIVGFAIICHCVRVSPTTLKHRRTGNFDMLFLCDGHLSRSSVFVYIWGCD